MELITNFISVIVGCILTIVVIYYFCPTGRINEIKNNTNKSLSLTDEWDKIFQRSNKVITYKVKFKNRFGIELVGDLYIPKDTNKKDLLPAIAICGPFGAVKEQASGLYAQTLAERGFITLAFDASFTGESGGNVRDVASPDINTEDFSAAVDYLINLPQVDANKVGILGICGFGGFALNAAAQDTRIKATTTITMYDMTRVSAKGYNDSMSEEDLYKLREQLNNQRTVDTKTGKYAKAEPMAKTTNDTQPQFLKDYINYYQSPIGFHKRSIASNGSWNITSTLSLITQPILAYSHTIKHPVLMIHGEKAHSRYFSEDAFQKLRGNNKELFIVKDANHTDLYYKTDVIPFKKIEDFFKTNLSNTL